MILWIGSLIAVAWLFWELGAANERIDMLRDIARKEYERGEWCERDECG